MDDYRLQKLNVILQKVSTGKTPSRDESIFILQLRETELIETLFKKARQLRETFFNNHIFLYGFIYTTTFCRNNCNFCFYRKDNPLSSQLRYRKEESEILSAALHMAEHGVHLIDLTMAEDPHLYGNSPLSFAPLITLVEKVKKITGLPVMVSPGVVPVGILKKLAGASWFACYQETHNRDLFARLRPRQDYDERLNSKIRAHELGMLIEEGILVGVGESDGDIVDSLEAVSNLKADQVRAMNFVPQQGTQMEGIPTPDPLRELLIIALMRLHFPGTLIPATLDVEGIEGLKKRLDAGANVVTSIVPPSYGLAGVAQATLDIDESRRSVEHVTEVLQVLGLKPATLEQYKTWMDKRAAIL